MMSTLERLLVWAPRVLGIGACMFIGLFALDAFTENSSRWSAAGSFAMHLVPALLLLALVVLAWRWEWVGGVGFISLAIVYATIARSRLDWVLVIAGPLFVVGALFLWSWRVRQLRRAPSF